MPEAREGLESSPLKAEPQLVDQRPNATVFNSIGANDHGIIVLRRDCPRIVGHAFIRSAGAGLSADSHSLW
jgi:hypothetical protein